MNFWLVENRPSVKCHRSKHDSCKNKNKQCGCECHKIVQLNLEKTKSDLQILDDYVCMKFRRFLGVRHDR